MRLHRIDYLWISAQALLFIVYLLPVDLGIKAPNFPQWPTLMIMLLGAAECLWALIQLGKFLSPFPKPKENAPLISGGIFGLVRHPIYSGIFLFAAAWAFYSANLYRLLIALAILLFFYYKSRYEEQNLKAYFSDYAAYAERVGRFFPKLKSFGTKP